MTSPAKPASETVELRVPDGPAPQRLDLFVGKALGLSRATLKKLFERAAVRVDGRIARKGHRVERGQCVRVEVETGETAAEPDPSSPLAVLHRDEALIFVDKPSGMPSHPLEPGERGTVANALVARYPECRNASEDPREGGLCHRLDVDTSGVILAARAREPWLRVREAFSTGKVDKRYWALVTGPIAEQGEIDVPLRHHPRRKERVEPALDRAGGGRPARSLFQVLARSGQYSFVEVRIITGVLHQVRAHLAAIGAPVVGDPLYGGETEEGEGSPGIRLCLHARSLELIHPAAGSIIRVESPLPPELGRILVTRSIAWGEAAIPTRPSP